MIKLIEFTGGNSHPFGNVQGRQTLQALLDYVDTSVERVLEISLEGIEATDASFPRESVISLVKQLKGEKYFFLTHFSSPDLIDNWNYAAKAKQQWLVIWQEGQPMFIGPDINASTKELLFYVLKNDSVTTAGVAKDLEISVQNASTRLKRLANEGFIIRDEESSLSGGKEFVYKGLKNSA